LITAEKSKSVEMTEVKEFEQEILKLKEKPELQDNLEEYGFEEEGYSLCDIVVIMIGSLALISLCVLAGFSYHEGGNEALQELLGR